MTVAIFIFISIFWYTASCIFLRDDSFFVIRKYTSRTSKNQLKFYFLFFILLFFFDLWFVILNIISSVLWQKETSTSHFEKLWVSWDLLVSRWPLLSSLVPWCLELSQMRLACVQVPWCLGLLLAKRWGVIISNERSWVQVSLGDICGV